MSPHFYVNSLVLLPPWKWWVARKKVQTPFYIPCSCHTLYRYILCYTDSFLSRIFPIFELVQHKYFWENRSHNFWPWSFLQRYWHEFQICHKKEEVAVSSWIRYKLVCLPSSSKIPLPLKVGKYPAVARQWVQEPTYAKYSAIYIKRPFKPSYVVKNWCLWTLPKYKIKSDYVYPTTVTPLFGITVPSR